MDSFLFFLLLFAVAQTAIVDKPLEDEESDAPAKRGFGSYFSNSFYDEIAMSICASISTGRGGLIFPIRKRCHSKKTCYQICKSQQVVSQTASWLKTGPVCLDSLHIYRGRGQLAPNPGAETDVGRVGLTTWRYHTCHQSGCGPNYCCCKKSY